MVYKEQLERMLSELKERREDLYDEMSELPEGVLISRNQRGVKQYLQRIPAAGNRKKERRYGLKRRPELLSDLVRKKYVQEALVVLDSDIRIIEKALGRYVPSDENSVMAGFVNENPEIAGAIYRATIDEEAWSKRFGRMDDFHSEHLMQTAADGTKMRSKNEIYIASRLDHYGLTYRSDCPTGIPGLYRVPDFTVLRKRDGKVIYWEHMGMMDNIEYRRNNKRKLEEYEEAGIVPWDNLIVTYDTAKGGLRADIIEAMIKGWLLS